MCRKKHPPNTPAKHTRCIGHRPPRAPPTAVQTTKDCRTRALETGAGPDQHPQDVDRAPPDSRQPHGHDRSSAPAHARPTPPSPLHGIGTDTQGGSAWRASSRDAHHTRCARPPPAHTTLDRHCAPMATAPAAEWPEPPPWRGAAARRRTCCRGPPPPVLAHAVAAVPGPMRPRQCMTRNAMHACICMRGSNALSDALQASASAPHPAEKDNLGRPQRLPNALHPAANGCSKYGFSPMHIQFCAQHLRRHAARWSIARRKIPQATQVFAPGAPPGSTDARPLHATCI